METENKNHDSLLQDESKAGFIVQENTTLS